MTALRPFLEGAAKRLGEWSVSLILSSAVVGGTLLAWLKAHALTLQLTRIQVVGCAFVYLASIATAVWVTRTLCRRRRKFHLTQVGHRNHWGMAEAPDGSISTYITADVLAKNLTYEPILIVSVRLIRPRFPGHVNASNIWNVDVGEPTRLPPKTPAQLGVFLNIQGAPKTRPDFLRALLLISDDEGHTEKLRATLRWVKPQSPKAATPATLPATK